MESLKWAYDSSDCLVITNGSEFIGFSTASIEQFKWLFNKGAVYFDMFEPYTKDKVEQYGLKEISDWRDV
jgi:hypothetical protein